MNPTTPMNPNEEREARLTALLLGELPHEEAAALHATLAQDADLAKLYERLKQTMYLVRETVSSPAGQTAPQPEPLKLSEERRQKLLAQFKTVAPKEFAQPRRRGWVTLVQLGAAAAIVAIIAAIAFPNIRSFKMTSQIGDETLFESMERMALSSARAGRSLGQDSRGAPTPAAAVSQAPVESPAPSAAHVHSPAPESSRTIERYGRSDGTDASPGPPASGASAAAGIVLPRASEAANSPTTAAVTGGAQDPSSVSLTLRGFYDNNSGASGGSGGAATFGGFAASGNRSGGSAGGGGAGSPARSPATLAEPTLSLDWDGNSEGSAEPMYRLGFVTGNSTLTTPPVQGGAKHFWSDGDLRVVPTAPGTAKLEAVDPATGLPVPLAGPAPSLMASVPAPVPAAPQAGTFTFGVTLAPAAGEVAKVPSVLAAGNEVAGRDQTPTKIEGENWFSGGAGVARGRVQGQAGTPPMTRGEAVTPATPGIASSPTIAFANSAPGQAPSEGPRSEAAGYLVMTNAVLTDLRGDRGSMPALGDVPMAGRLYRSEQPGPDNRSQAASKAEPAAVGAKIGPDSGTRESMIVTDAGTPRSISQAVADKSKQPARQPVNESVKLQDKLAEVDLAFGVPPQLGEGQKNKDYFEAKRNLAELERSRQVLNLKMASEKIDVDLPKSGLVDVVERATPEAPQQGVFGKIRGAFSSEVEKKARVRVDRDVSDISGLADERSNAAYDPYFVQTESEVIQSEAILGKVVKDLKLDEAWAKQKGAGVKLSTEDTVALLKKKLDLRPEKGTALLDIGVKSDKPEEAARIANAVADAYKEHRLEQRRKMVMGGVEALKQSFDAQEAKVHEAQANVERLRKELSISDASTPMSAETLRQIEGLRTETPAQIVRKAAAAGEPDVSRKIKAAVPAAEPQPEVQAAANPFSTFSLNVSDVSFRLAAASLEKGVLPEPASVRTEEFINAFDYRDPEPAPGAPLAFAWERAAYPFSQNRDLLRFSVQTAALGRQPGRPLNLVLLLDNSGSMERADRVQIIREALRVLAAQLQPQDRFSLVTFSRTARLWVDGIPGNQAAQAAEEASKLTPQGGTNLDDAMYLAYQTALRHYLANGVNRVVLLTDGAANLGNVDPDALKQKVETNRKQGIALDCFGIGWEGYNDDLLEVLSRHGDGRYGFVNSTEEAATEFAGQLAGALHVAASDVKVQVEFNPSRVTAYRQIGYAKHQLTKQQFRDNTVDAAEIAAAESGNALYVIEVNPAGAGPLATVRVRYKVPGTSDYHEHEWAVPYTGNAVALQQASPPMRLAAVASAFSERLVSSPYATEVSPDRLLGYLSGVPDVYGADGRPKKLEWMIRQATSLEGK